MVLGSELWLYGADAEPEFEIDNSFLSESATSSGTHVIALGSEYGSGYSSTIDNRRKRTIAYWCKMQQCVGFSDAHNWQFVHWTGSVSENISVQNNHDNPADVSYNSVSMGGSIIKIPLIDAASWFHFMVQVDTTNTDYGTSDPSSSPTARGRVKIWINGVHKQWDNHLDSHQGLPGYNHYPGGNDNTDSSDGQSTLIGNGARRSCYIADLHYLDNTIADATDFGKFNDDGIWIPIETSFTTAQYGSAGAHLEFKQTGTSSNGQSSTGIGADTSGNNNHAYIYQNLLDIHGKTETDTPTNNFNTINSLDNAGDGTPDGGVRATLGGRKITNTGSYGKTRAHQSVSAGKWYYEVETTDIGSHSSHFVIALTDANWPMAFTGNSHGYLGADLAWTIMSDGTMFHGTAGTGGDSNVADFTGSNSFHVADGDIMIMALDMDNGKFWIGKNGTWWNTNAGTANPATGANAAITNILTEGVTDCLVGFGHYGSSDRIYQVNFGNPTFTLDNTGVADGNGYGSFEYTPPSGFYAMCSKNFAEFDPPAANDPSKYFQTDMYKATSSNDSVVFGGNSAMQPDMIMVKDQTVANSWQIHDSSRGPTAGALHPDTNVAETSLEIDSFDSDGYTNDASNTGIHDEDSIIQSFGWKANGGSKTSVSQSGSGATQVLASTYQADTTGGFSICTWTGTGGAGKITHGLGAVPAVIWVKKLSGNYSWLTYHKDTGVDGGPGHSSLRNSLTGANAHNHYMNVETHYSMEENTTVWNDTAPDSTYFTVGTASAANTGTYVAYVWAEKKGISKFGWYKGNGNINGPFINTGFLPAMVIVKGADHDNGWFLWSHDMAIATSSYVSRSNESFRNRYMQLWDASTTATAASTHGQLELAFMSNGFKIMDSAAYINGSGKNSIYYAFAARPLVSSGGATSPANAHEMVASAGGNTFTGTA